MKTQYQTTLRRLTADSVEINIKVTEEIGGETIVIDNHMASFTNSNDGREFVGNLEIPQELKDKIFKYWGSNPTVVDPQKPTAYQKQGVSRSTRDRLLQQTDRYMLVDTSKKLTSEQFTDLKAYRQVLRDLPQQPGFETGDVEFPEVPTFLLNESE